MCAVDQHGDGHPLASRRPHAAGTVVEVSGVAFGGLEIPLIAGPCAIEDRAMYLEAARCARDCGASVLRGGLFKPRSSPHRFQGLGLEGMDALLEAKRLTGLPICAEVIDPALIDELQGAVDLFQVGTRNAQNPVLLRALGRARTPVLLKRGFGCTVEEWLGAAEFVLESGNPDVILCERGIRTFETATRFTLDISAVPVAKELTHLPVVVDPSHAAGDRRWVGALARAGIAAGADGLLIEVHPCPERSVTDAAQALTPAQFAGLTDQLRRVADAMSRVLR